MALCQENLPPSMLTGGGGRPSPTFFTAYGHGFVPPGGQAGSGGGGGPMGQYVQEHGQYHAQFHVPMGYDTASPSQQQQQHQQQQQPQPQQQQQQQPGEEGNPSVPAPHGHSWHYPAGHLHPRPAHVGLEDWGQHYLPVHPGHHPSAANGGTPPLHHQSHYNYPYRVPGGMEGYDPHAHGVETSPSTESNSPPGGLGAGPGGGASGTKQLRPPFEWMKPANVQPVPGESFDVFLYLLI